MTIMDKQDKRGHQPPPEGWKEESYRVVRTHDQRGDPVTFEIMDISKPKESNKQTVQEVKL